MVLSMHENWTLSAGFGYVDAEWDGGTLFATPGGNIVDLSGRTPPNTVNWSATAALDYDQQLNGDMRLFGRLQLRYKGEASTNAQYYDSPGDDYPVWKNPTSQSWTWVQGWNGTTGSSAYTWRTCLMKTTTSTCRSSRTMPAAR